MRTQDAQNIHCSDYLEKIGAQFARTQNGTHGLEYVYHSPIRADQKPSLCVNLDRNIWSDVPADAGGRLIELVCHTNGLLKNDVKEALSILDKLFPEYRGRGSSSENYAQPKYRPAERNSPNHAVSSVLSVPKSELTRLKEKGAGRQILRVREIYRYPLKNYLQERKIPLSIAQKYLQEIDYKDNQGRTFYALGWKSGETYGIRTKDFKSFLSKGIDLSVFDKESTEIYVFEGIFDYLAFLAHSGRTELPVTAIVMNSVALRTRLADWLSERPYIDRVNCYFDNDQSGQQCFSKLQSHFPAKTVRDYSSQYSKFKDFSDWFSAQ